MANFNEELEEIKTLLNSKTQKPLAYSMLLQHLQRHTAQEASSSSIQLLADSSHVVLSSILIDIADHDEEIAAQALKCLGFIIYHPTILASIAGDDAKIIVNSLLEVITTTKIKCVCNLGVWCISIQQFDVLVLDTNFDSLLRAIVHALDNPYGSLSITFEAMQAVTKLATSLGDKMRDVSNIWVPPIYRRLVSIDKRERDISERCLLKTKSIICPPLLTLSKALVLDMKKKLLSGIKELLHHGMKIQALQAWGWLIRLLGPYMMKNKNLVNEMLKIPEQTFSDFDPQVQIASLVAWEGLIDALVNPPAQASKANPVEEHGIMSVPEGNNIQTETDRSSKRVKLIMTPLIGIMSSKCDVSVHASSLNTWSYLLHKLDSSVVWDSVVKTVWEPIFEAVFQVVPNEKNIWLWNFCLDLLNTFILARSEDENDHLQNRGVSQPSAGNHADEPLVFGKCAWKRYPIKWSPWDLSQLDFFIKMIHGLMDHGSNMSLTPEYRRLMCSSALTLFRSLLKVIQNVLKCISHTYEETMLCLNTILRFLKSICGNVIVEKDGIDDLHSTCLLLLEAVTEDLNPSVLGSSLYQVALNLHYIQKLEPLGEFTHARIPGIRLIADSDMVPPVVYISVLYFCQVDQSISKAAEYESILHRMQRQVKFLISSYDPVEILQVFIGLLYTNKVFNCFKIWIALADFVKDYISCESNQSLLKMDLDNSGYPVILSLLAYPFAVYSRCRIQLELKHVTEAWNLLYVSVNHVLHFQSFLPKNFSEDLLLILHGFLDGTTIKIDTGAELHPRGQIWDVGFRALCGNAVICVLEVLTSNLGAKGSGNKNGEDNKSRIIKNSLEFSARFTKLCLEMKETDETDAQGRLVETSRIFSALIHLVGCIQLKDDILAFIKIMASPLLQWLSHVEVQDNNGTHKFQLLWTEILNSLRSSQPPIQFNSSFLKLQEPLLKRTMDHPNPTISEPTINFWNSTYGEQIKLEYPQSLVPILDKLSRNGKINLHKRSQPMDARIHSGKIDHTIPVLQRCMVTATLNRCSKRVELADDAVNCLQTENKLCLSSKRKWVGLTEHQKEVRRAQQGRARDCSGHGPGIHTYTSVDFSQGNEESQDSQEIRDANSILEMLRKVG